MTNPSPTSPLNAPLRDLYHPDQRALVVMAVERVHTRLMELAPNLAERTVSWLKRSPTAHSTADLFLHAGSFPMFFLPGWCEQTCQRAPSLTLQQDLAYMSVAGYYYIRLLDDLMDGDRLVPPALLPVLNVLLAEALRVPQRYFPVEHPFWAGFDQMWAKAAEATAQDTLLTAPDEASFRQVTAQKQYASNLLVAIVTYYYDCPALAAPWAHFIAAFSVWHQMLDDVFDWYKDFARGHTTYFLAEAARRKAPTESVAAWVTHSGFAWGCATLQAWYAEARAAARPLASPDLERYLDIRQADFDQRTSEVQHTLQQFLPILGVLAATPAPTL